MRRFTMGRALRQERVRPPAEQPKGGRRSTRRSQVRETSGDRPLTIKIYNTPTIYAWCLPQTRNGQSAPSRCVLGKGLTAPNGAGEPCIAYEMTPPLVRK